MSQNIFSKYYLCYAVYYLCCGTNHLTRVCIEAMKFWKEINQVMMVDWSIEIKLLGWIKHMHVTLNTNNRALMADRRLVGTNWGSPPKSCSEYTT